MIFKTNQQPIKTYLLALLLIATASLSAQTQAAHNLLQSGDMSYDAESYNTAETEYRKSIDESSSVKEHYNLGNSLYKQGNRAEEAVNAFQKAATEATDPLVKSKAYHNMGNALMQAGDLKEATKAYKNALRNNPQDKDSQYNLAQAMRALRQQQQQEQQQENQENQENQDQDQYDFIFCICLIWISYKSI